jgi:hypothetical protein
VTAVIPAATVLRQLPGRRLVVGRSEVVHVYATETRARCGWPLPDRVRVLEQVDDAPALRVCGRCLGSLPPSQLEQLRPDVAELAAVHDRQARLVAQRCIDELEGIRRRMRVDGTATVPVVLVKAGPARDPLAPRPKTRAERGRQRTGHIAVEKTMTLAALLNLLTPAGYTPDHRLYLLDPPPAGTMVDPQGRLP